MYFSGLNRLVSVTDRLMDRLYRSKCRALDCVVHLMTYASIVCVSLLQNESGYEMDCNMLPLFELGSVQRAQYLLNIRLPNSSSVGAEMRNDLRKLKEMSVYVSTVGGDDDDDDDDDDDVR